MTAGAEAGVGRSRARCRWRSAWAAIGSSLCWPRSARPTADPREQRLAQELRRFIEDALTGRIDDSERIRRLQHPRDALDAPRHDRSRRTRRRVPSGVTTLRDAAAKLEEMIVNLAPDRRPESIWNAFRRFASVPVESDAEERVDHAGQLLFVEWGPSVRDADSSGEPEFWVDLVRQIPLVGQDGGFVDLEQIHATIVFGPTEELESLGADVIFSEQTSSTADAFFAEVESSSVWNALSGSHSIVRVTVYQERAE